MIAIDYTVLIQIGAFLLFWFLLRRLIFGPFLDHLEERERKTDGVKATTAALEEEGERLRMEYEKGVERAKNEGRMVKEEIRNEALQTRERLLSRAREEAGIRLQREREALDKESQRALESGAREAQVIAGQMVEKILGRSVG